MKVSVLPLFVSALGLASQVQAAPIRIYVFGDSENPSAVIAGKNSLRPLPPPPSDPGVAHMRWGMAAADAQQLHRPIKIVGAVDNVAEDDTEGGHRRFRGGRFRGGRPPMMGGCGRGNVRGKALKLQNWLRSIFGMEPINPHPHGKLPASIHWAPHRPEHGPKHGKGADSERITVLPFPMNTSGSGTWSSDGDYIESVRIMDPPHHRPHHFRRPHTFTGRISKALMTLGPWEGRAVAFVLGCGIGALLRMFFVLTVLAFRSSSRRSEDDMEEITVIFDHVEPPLPRYTDEKKPIEESTSA